MKSLSLKLDDELFKELENIRTSLKEARNRFINEAIEYFIEYKKSELLKQQLAFECKMLKNETGDLVKELENYDNLSEGNEW